MKILDAKGVVVKEWDRLAKLPAWQMTKRKEQKRSHSGSTKKEQNTVHFSTLMDICHLKNTGQRRNIWNTKEGMYTEVTKWQTILALTLYSETVFVSATNDGRKKRVDVIARPAGCAGQAADAVSACTQNGGRFTIAATSPNQECPDIWTRLPGLEWPASWSNIEQPVCASWANSERSPTCRINRVLLEIECEKVPKWRCLFVHRGSVPVCVRQKQHLDPVWETLMKYVDLGTLFLDHVHVGCTQRECKPNEGVQERLTSYLNRRQGCKRYLRGRTTWKGHTRECVERCCDLANKTNHQLYKVSTPCLDDHFFQKKKKKHRKRLENCPTVCSQNGLELLLFGTNWRIWHSLVCEQTGTSSHKMDKSLLQTMLVWFLRIHHTNNCRQYCHVGYTANHCRLVLLQDSDFAGDLEDSKSASERILCIFGSRTFVPICLDV